MKKCPYCAEEIADEAIKCKHCGEFLNKVPDAPKTPWYFKSTSLVGAFLIAGPFALPLVWLHPRLDKKKKLIITVLTLIVTYFLTVWTMNAMKTLNAQLKQLGLSI